jgi:prepilin-type N-terminal cleavage/methylation domain-containing protein
MMRPPNQRGFTLIELLVTVTVLMVITGGGIAAYLNFNTKQILIQSGQDVLFLMRSAQKKARVGDKPQVGCARLVSYEVKMPAGGGNIIDLNAICSNPATILAKRLTLPAGVTVSSGSTVQFFVLAGGVSAPQTISVTNGTNTFRFAVGAGGDISEGVVE